VLIKLIFIHNIASKSIYSNYFVSKNTLDNI